MIITRLPHPTLSYRRVLDAAVLNANQQRLVDAVNGGLSANALIVSQAGTGGPASTLDYNAFTDNQSLICTVFKVVVKNANFFWTLNRPGNFVSWHIVEIASNNNSQVAAGQKTSRGWTSAVKATLSSVGVPGGALTTLSVIQRASRARVENVGARYGLPDDDIVLSAFDFTTGNFSGNAQFNVIFDNTVCENAFGVDAGYLVYVYTKHEWATL